MKALLRSALFGSLLGIAVLLGCSWSLVRMAKVEEPRPIPDAALAARELHDAPHSSRERVYVDPNVQVPIAADDRTYPGKPVGFHESARAALVGGSSLGATNGITLVALTLGGNPPLDKPSYRAPSINSRDVVLAGGLPVLKFSTNIENQKAAIRDVTLGKNVVGRISGDTLSIVEELSPGRHELEVLLGTMEPKEQVATLNVLVPASDSVIKKLEVDGTAAGDLLPIKKNPSATNPILVNAYGKPASLRIKGSNLSSDSIVHVIAVIGDEIKFVRAEHVGDRTLTGQWTIREVFPGDLKGKVTLFLAQRNGEKLSNFSVPMEVTIAEPQMDLAGANLQITGLDGKNVTANGVSFLRAQEAALIASWTGDFADNLGVVLHAFVDNTQQPHLSEYVSQGMTSKSLSLSKLPLGTHSLIVALQQGNGELSYSKAIKYKLRTEGPRVESIEPTDFGANPDVTALKVTFSRDNKIVDFKPEHVELRPGNGAGGFSHTEKAVMRPLQVKKISTEDNSFLLTFGAIEVSTYELTLSEAIKDEFGNSLVGTDGKPGTPYIHILGRAPSDEDSADPRGVVQTTGRYVPYQEFTRPRAQQDGFNPSDKVETRVARLYYFRDAHRVAQIINRKVQSFNRQGVDTAPVSYTHLRAHET